MASAAQFRIQRVATKPRGWRVRTKREGEHELRIGFPPGPRHRGVGKLLEILHPKSERNPECQIVGKNPAELVIFGNPSNNRELEQASEKLRKARERLQSANTQKEKREAAAEIEFWGNKAAYLEHARINPTHMRVDGVVGKVVDTRGSAGSPEYLLETKDGKRVWVKPRHRPRLNTKSNPHRAGCSCAICKNARGEKHAPGCGCAICQRNRGGKSKTRGNPKQFSGWKSFSKYEKNFLRRIHVKAPRNEKEVQAAKEMLRKIDVTNARHRSTNPDLYDAIRHGDRVTIVNRFGQQRTGRAVMRGPAGWVLNMGGPHGTPAIASPENVTRVKKSNRAEPPIGWQQWQDQMYKRITKILKAQGKADNYTLGDLEQAEKTADRQLRAELGGGYERNSRHRNQADEMGQAVKLYQTFHGKDPSGIVEKHVSAAMRLEYTALGDLEYLIVVPEDSRKAVKIDFEGDHVKLAASPEGNQLYFIGGNQNLASCLDKFTDDPSKDFIELGSASELQYFAHKSVSNFQPVSYFHKFGEESGSLPMAFYDKLKKQVFLIGGEYRIEAPGITN